MERAHRDTPFKHPFRLLVLSLAFLLLALPLGSGASASAATLDRIREAAKITFGYRTDARPFSYQEASGGAAGYSVALCEKIAEAVKEELGLSSLSIEWVPVTLDDRFAAVQQGRVDLLCGADTVTLARRKEVSFSIPIFVSGIGALLHSDASSQLRDALRGRDPSGPFWRGNPAQLLQKKTFSVVGGTTGEAWIAERLKHLQIDADVVTVDSYEAGVQGVLDRSVDAFFGDRAILLDAAAASPVAGDVTVLRRFFTREPLALALARGDEDFRLIVDRTLSGLLGSPDLPEMYRKWFGRADEDAIAQLRMNVLPE
jgi:putrescine:ornithine antiporter